MLCFHFFSFILNNQKRFLTIDVDLDLMQYGRHLFEKIFHSLFCALFVIK